MAFNIIREGKNNSTIKRIVNNGKTLVTPTYFPSITSAETRTNIGALIQEIVENKFPRLLLSCYDLVKFPVKKRKEVIKSLTNYSKQGNFLLLDSGEFERYHFDSKNWSFNKYKQMIKETQPDFYVSFDITPSRDSKYIQILKNTQKNAPISIALKNNNNCFLVCHGQSPDEICRLITELLKTKKSFCETIALVEREVGSTLEEQCKTIFKIRKILKKYKQTSIMHLLGCGNPISMAALSYAGIDTYDAVDWSRWLIDNKTLKNGNLSHVKHLDCSCMACISKTLLPKERAWQHNLLFYQDFMSRLQNSIARNLDLVTFLKNENVDQKVISNLAKLF